MTVYHPWQVTTGIPASQENYPFPVTSWLDFGSVCFDFVPRCCLGQKVTCQGGQGAKPGDQRQQIHLVMTPGAKPHLLLLLSVSPSFCPPSRNIYPSTSFPSTHLSHHTPPHFPSAHLHAPPTPFPLPAPPTSSPPSLPLPLPSPLLSPPPPPAIHPHLSHSLKSTSSPILFHLPFPLPLPTHPHLPSPVPGDNTVPNTSTYQGVGDARLCTANTHFAFSLISLRSLLLSISSPFYLLLRGPAADKNECRRCVKVLQELENVDDDADQLGIAFVKINDAELADEYSLGALPALVYYRRRIPVVYDGDLMNEDKVLEWLVENKNTGDDDDFINDVTAGLLNTLIDSMDHLAVIFYDRDESDDTVILQELENIDDELDAQGIHIVKIADDVAAKDYGIEDTPALVYFEHEIPSLYDGDLHNEEEVLAWLVEQLHTDEIEDVTDEMLDKLIRESDHLAVLFYDEDEPESQQVVNELENIDDECDASGVSFVKIDNDDEAQEYGIEKLPTLVYFEKGIPWIESKYEFGAVRNCNLLAEDEVLDWLVHQVEDDEIEDVTDEMLDRLIDRTEHLAVLFYDKDSRRSRKVLSELENIDDECDNRGIFFVKIDNDEEAKEYGIEAIPTLVYFESEIPLSQHPCFPYRTGDLMKEEEVLEWLLHHVDNEEIADVTDEMLDKLITNEPFLAVLFSGVPFVKIDNDAEAKEYGIEELPTLVYFENRIPSIYEGDLSNEQEVLAWLLQQKNTDTIEEVTDEILDDLIGNFEYVVVYFSEFWGGGGGSPTPHPSPSSLSSHPTPSSLLSPTPPPPPSHPTPSPRRKVREGEKCDKILDELENIDDDTDDHGMHFVTTEETSLAHQHGIKTLPPGPLQERVPVVYKGDLADEEAVLAWLTSENTLEIPNQIEEVNERMLDRILNTSDNVAVFFYSEGDKKSRDILVELENIDDECDDIGIDFVKVSDENIAKEYEVVILPALVYFRNRFPQIYEGDLKDEEALLEWLIDNKDKGPASIIEEVDGQMIQSLVEGFEYLVVYFYDDNCPTCETVLADLETIDDETDDVGIQFVKTNDVEVAEDLGISHLPALVYFEGGVPSIYDGDIQAEEDVLEWLIEQRHEDTIENINRQLLYTLIDTQDYLAVYFFSLTPFSSFFFPSIPTSPPSPLTLPSPHSSALSLPSPLLTPHPPSLPQPPLTPQPPYTPQPPLTPPTSPHSPQPPLTPPTSLTPPNP
ncbi:hypothetical protein C7M84_014912 [Penaeus vannamei]|uniref:Thioredoxin domain-containing protein n=1 Tax=Penaeus vannamei TaxID=6689 RepID=A0A423SS40_PENVA|nr:hypothetical protein C7M84_014912 [Penaeus vannamei]